MNNEIKEILDMLKDSQYIPSDDNRTYKLLDRDDTRHLLDYITNLQQENEDNLKCINSLKEQLESVIKNNQELLEKWHKNNDKIVNLISENERLKEENNKFNSHIQSQGKLISNLRDMKNIDYKSRCEKASEKLGNYKHYSTPTEEQNSENEDIVDSALNILQNGSESDE